MFVVLPKFCEHKHTWTYTQTHNMITVPIHLRFAARVNIYILVFSCHSQTQSELNETAVTCPVIVAGVHNENGR